ncbi:MAG: hypothetical protein QNJ54_31635 [Prochloraceae cyanobacterium]|nr:hypothetical protein [Prochloraceae cyanobacterium]
MKLLIRSTLLISLVGGSILGAITSVNQSLSWLSTAPAQALPLADIQKKLKTIPVFILTDKSGKEAITVSVQEGNSKQQLGIFFFSPKDAEAVLRELRVQKPQMSQNAQIKTINLNEAYELAQQPARNRTEQNIKISFQPSAHEVKKAIQLLKSRGQKIQQFNGVPLFYATKGDNKTLISVEILDEQQRQVEKVVIPVFFSQQDLEDLLADMRQQNPQLGSEAKIQITSLDDLVTLMKDSNQSEIQQIVFMPSTEALEFLRKQ